MTKNSCLSVLLVLLFFGLPFLNGQQDNARKFEGKAMSKYADQNSFDYMNYTVRPPSIWERISWWFQNFVQELFLNPNTPWLTRIAYYLVLLLVIGAVVFYIIRLRYSGGITADYKSYRSETSSVMQAKPEDFESLIQDALKEQNFKLAVRYLYLKSLSSLSKKGKISLRDWKSPYDYHRELTGDIADSYIEIAQLFEYIWYGDFEAGQAAFQRGNELAQKLDAVV